MSVPREHAQPLPKKEGQYFWSEWQKFVMVGMAHPYNWKKPSKRYKRCLCVLPFAGFPHPIKISERIAGEFYGSI